MLCIRKIFKLLGLFILIFYWLYISKTISILFRLSAMSALFSFSHLYFLSPVYYGAAQKQYRGKQRFNISHLLFIIYYNDALNIVLLHIVDTCKVTPVISILSILLVELVEQIQKMWTCTSRCVIPWNVLFIYWSCYIIISIYYYILLYIFIFFFHYL